MVITLTQITACEFLIKGYHYTKPTNPTRTDSCRLHLDTSIEGEESTVEEADSIYTWVAPETADLDETETELLRLKGIHGFYFQN